MNTSSGSGAAEYRPPPKQHSLFQSYCDLCGVEALCGENGTETACGHPAQYLPHRFHPTANPVSARDLLIPESNPPWSDIELTYRHSLVVASEPSPPIGPYGVDLKTALYRRGPGVAAGAIAFLLGRDTDLETAWSQRGRLGRVIAKKGFRAAVAPAFSTWHDDPPYEGLVSVARTVAVAQAMAPQIPTIPSLVWRTAKDIERQVSYLTRSDPPIWIAVDLGRSEEAVFQWLLEGLSLVARTFAQQAGSTPSLLAYGPGTTGRVARVQETWPAHVVIASQMPYLTAVSGRRLDSSLARIEAPEYSHRELIELNASVFEASVVEAWAPRISSSNRASTA